MAAALFLCLFAAQAGFVVLTPVLPLIAIEFDTSPAAVGQLRTLTGLVAASAALLAGVLGPRVGLRRLLLAGVALLGAGSAASAVAPSLATLAVAQAVVGAGAAILVAAATAAAVEWAGTGDGTRLLSWSLVGSAAAWVVGLPLAGAAAEAGWRFVWLVPVTAAVAAAAAVVGRRTASRPVEPAAFGTAVSNPRAARWLLTELLAASAWAGVVVYAGSLLFESYGVSPLEAGVVLSGGGAAYVVGNRLLQRTLGSGAARLLPTLTVALAAAVALFGAVRPSTLTSALLFGLAAFLAGGRTLAGYAAGAALESSLRRGAFAARAAVQHLGYFVGSAAGGVTLAAGGYEVFGLALGALLVGAALIPIGSRSAASLHSPGTPASACRPRSSNSRPDPATRSRTVWDTRTSPAPASAATRAPM